MTNEYFRKLLLAVSLKACGDYDKIMRMITDRDFPSDEEIENAEQQIKSGYITYLDDEYPESLKQTNRPPIVLYYYGDISLLYKEKKAIAVIGSRECSDIGVEITQRFVSELATDYLIVSGMAKGIDAVAHESAIRAGGKTVAVLGSGIDYCYPYENYNLYRILRTLGLVISEYPNATVPEIINFPMRNRIIAGLAKGILITEAKKKSGTLITVNWGQMFSKEIMCVPYRIDDESGCNELIKEGAYLVEDSDEVRLIMDGTGNLKKSLMQY
ncbi:MAG: DNA-protecting protein DprA [Erysipelotrichaceae bacterium]|nr:DNA-protecting protein DprA [Erysipelotrichaceae bacterium]